MDVSEEYLTKGIDAKRLLPAWFIPRMMDDCWSFGLLLITGHTLAIECIEAVHLAADGSLWIDVTMKTGEDVWLRDSPGRLLFAPTSRTTASVNVAQIVAAFELADT
jgi:hypothetical protein